MATDVLPLLIHGCRRDLFLAFARLASHTLSRLSTASALASEIGAASRCGRLAVGDLLNLRQGFLAYVALWHVIIIAEN